MDCEMTGTRADTQPIDRQQGGIVSPDKTNTRGIIPAQKLSESSVSPNHSREFCAAAAVIG